MLKIFLVLSDQTKCKVIPSVVNRGKFYALPKIHKSTLAFHLIVSNVGTSPYTFARFLSQSLAPLTCNKL